MRTTRRADGALRRRAAIKAPASEPAASEGDEDPVRLGAALELLLRHQHTRHLEVQAEGANEEHHAHDEHHVRLAADVRQSLTDLPLCPWAGWGRAKQSAVHHQQRADKGCVAERIGQDRPTRSDCCDHEPSERGADDPRGMERGRVEPDRVRKVVGTSHLGYEALPCGVVKRGAKTERRMRSRRHARSSRRQSPPARRARPRRAPATTGSP